MNPSRIFIDRPVATSLLMIAILLVGIVAFRFLPLSALPEVDYPTIQVQTFYPGASPEVMTSAVTAPLGAAIRPDGESQPDDVAKLRRLVGHHVEVRPRHRPRHRRAGSAGGDQRRRQSFARRPAGAADLRQGQSGRRADPDARRRFERDEADRRRRHHRDPPRAEIVGASRRRAGLDLGGTAALRPHPRQSARPFFGRRQSRRFAHDDQQPQRQHAQGKFRRPRASLGDQRQRSDPRSERLRQVGHRLPQRRADPALRRRDRRDRAREQPPLGHG